ncbi:glycoside hydrolase family protein [Pseudescherichia sp.]|uniref:glycoside hydrolase family protein n=1 Tax=Pseudescherichia sp. TaxID=2055881 RepID=UPI0028A0E117|nr:glycoside hydrolase family protein [Pseudescherichia sp.]
MDIKTRLKEYEGTATYQAKMKYYRNGKFYPYYDSEGFATIGYGHLIKRGEDFSTGLTDAQADALLDKDIAIARTNVKVLQLTLPDDWNDFMIIMVFQLGLGGVQKFKKMIAALKMQNYSEAIKQAKDSLWYRQTPNRIDSMISQLRNK